MSNFPSVRPTLNLKFDSQPTPEAMLSHLKSVGATFDRGAEASQIATYVDSKGIIQLAPANYPRPNYDPVTGEHKGLLIEEGRTNYFKDSDPSTDPAQGTRSNISFAANDWGIGLNGKVVFGDNSVTRDYYNTDSIDVTDTHSISFIIKPDDGNAPTFGIGSSDICRIRIASQIPGATTIKDIGNGLFYVTAQASQATTTATNGLQKRTDNNNVGFEVSAIQIEKGSRATSYIPTTGTTATRATDYPYIEDAGGKTPFSDFYNQTEGTFVVEFESGVMTTGKQGWLFEAYRGGNDLISSYVHENGSYRPRIIKDGVSWASLQGDASFNTLHKYALRYGVNENNHFADGAKLSEPTSSLEPPTGLSKLNIGSSEGSGSTRINGHIKRLLYFPVALSDTELENLTYNG